MTKDEALQMCLEYIETDAHERKYVRHAIKAALEAKDEPVAWEGGEDWESLAWQLCADECGEEACTELIWEGGPIPEPWGDRWMKYEYEAKRLIALVRKHTTPPQRKPLTDEEIVLIVAECAASHQHTDIHFAKAIEAKLKEKNT